MATIFSECMGWIVPLLTKVLMYGGVLYFGVIILVKMYPDIFLEVLFLNRVCPPRRIIQLHKPQKKYKLKDAHNHYVKSSSGNTLGVWHIPSDSKYDAPGNSSNSLSDAEKVIVYCHGNAFHRGFWHRCDLYKSLQSGGYHVVTFDYSGFGDSTGWPKPGLVVEDAISIYKWTIEQVKEDASVVLWGHSLGTAVSTKALSLLCEENGIRLPDALILEAPFTNIVEAADTFPLSKMFYALYPYLKADVHKSVVRNKAELATEKVLPSIHIPILILHAEDDHRIPLFLGEKLYQKTTSDPETKSRFIRFIRMHERHEVKHYTATHPEITSIFEEFMEQVQSAKVKGDIEENKVRYEMIDV